MDSRDIVISAIESVKKTLSGNRLDIIKKNSNKNIITQQNNNNRIMIEQIEADAAYNLFLELNKYDDSDVIKNYFVVSQVCVSLDIPTIPLNDFKGIDKKNFIKILSEMYSDVHNNNY